VRSDWIISGCGHVAIFVAGFVTLASSKPNVDMANLLPIAVVTDKDISQAALGQTNAPNRDKRNPLADKVDAQKQVEQVAPKAAPKPEIKTDTGPPKPQQKPPEQKPDPKPEPKTAEKPDKKEPQFKPDKIADLLKKEDKPKPREQKQTEQSPKYDASEIAQLLDHRDPRRELATGSALNQEASLGAPNAPAAAKLSQSEIDALRQRIRECWSPPPGVDSDSNLYVELRVLFRQDGSLAQAPVVVAGSASPLGPALAESGKRALLQCQPFTMLKPEHYAQWRDITVNFNPRELSN
jgi:outer membrane biosynthesis protein TonB